MFFWFQAQSSVRDALLLIILERQAQRIHAMDYYPYVPTNLI